MSETTSLSYAVVIPARYKSSRFPGKPLVSLLGKPMIQWVWELSCKAVGPELVFIATDDQRIENACIEFGAQVVMTSDSCLTGTDRLAEVNELLGKDFLINVQGDEPLLDPQDIIKVRDSYIKSPEVIVNAMCRIPTELEYRSLTVPKVVVSKTGKLLYMSRAGIPTTKQALFEGAMKQVCIYAFSSTHLKFFASHSEKTPIEMIEDIEILRFLENDIAVQMIEVDAGSAAVDTQEDVVKVIELLHL